MYRWILALSLVATAARAQGASATIDPGMTKAQVIQHLGKPATERSYQGNTYLLYSNTCGKSCGMQDLVVLDHDAVIDAVFRSPNRHYTGTSSSPEATKANARASRGGTLAVPPASPVQQPRPAAAPTPPADSSATATSIPPVPVHESTTTELPQPAPATTTNAPVTPQTPPATTTSTPPRF